MRRSTLIPALAACLVFCAVWTGLQAAEPEDGFVSLFDGQTLEGWSGKEQFWSVRDGAITGQTTPENPTEGNTFLIWRGGELKDFELRLKFRIVGGNSGVQYRSEDVGDHVVKGYQADIDSTDQFIGILYEERGRGILALRCEEVVMTADGAKQVVGSTCKNEDVLASLKKEDWNEYVIRADGNVLTQTLNGHTTVKVTDNDESKRSLSGILALQLHAGPPMLVQFKDLQLKHLNP